ncbi:MAG: protein kinase [Planctomycetes bacterium]|nr:protein kinase [Planctomycetota bacterium]
MPYSSDSTTSNLFELADQILADLGANRLQPLAHYLARFPGHEEAVAREYLALTTGWRAAAPPTAKEREAQGSGAERPRQIGPFRIVSVLGRGGQGVVYRAEDVRFERIVALKVLNHPLSGVSQSRRSRLRREAEIVSRLDHPGICTILDAELDGETPYIAMRFIEGETLAMALARARESRSANTPSSTTTSASRLLRPERAIDLAATLVFFERVARALHAAHEAGVVHRDVKPGNIMVASDGAPVVLDFGLARGADEESALLTRSGEVFGTPAYISPEQLDSGHRVDRRTDVYSLGVVLYECLTLDRPFTGENGAQLAEAIRTAAVAPATKHNAALPADLAVVLDTALEKNVERRYPTALELAEELRRVREYEPIRARPAGPFLRLARWAQRNPVLATGTLGTIAALSIALGVALVLLGRVRDEQARKEGVLRRYEGAYYRDFAASTTALWPVRALHYAIAAAERDPGLASNRVLLQALETLYQKQALVWNGGLATWVDVSPDSQRIVSASSDGVARLWDPETGRELARFGNEGSGIHCVRFDSADARIVTAGADGHVRVFGCAKPGRPELDLSAHASDANWAEFSPDGARIVTAGRDHAVRMFDAASGTELLHLEGHTGNVSEARFVRGGAWILTRSGEPWQDHPAPESDSTARLFDARSGAQLHVFGGHSEQVRSAALSRDGRWLATASADRTARLYRLDASTPMAPEPTQVFTAPGKFHSVDFSPDGTRLALAYDAGARIVETATGRVLQELPSHDRRAVVWIAFSPDGDRLATAAYDSALRVFRVSDGALLRVCKGDTRSVHAGVWSPDGAWLATWQMLSQVDLWFAGDRPFLQVLRSHSGEVVTARFDARAERVVTASKDGTARAWSALDGRALALFAPEDGSRAPLTFAEFDPIRPRVVTSDARGVTRLWSFADAREVAGFECGSTGAVPGRFDPTGSFLFMAEGPAGMRIVDAAADPGAMRTRSTSVAAHEVELGCARFSADGALLVTGGRDRCVAVWSVERTPGAPRVTLLWRTEPFATQRYDLDAVFDVDVDRSEGRVVAAYQSMAVALLDLGTGRELAATRTSTVGRVRFFAGGSHFFATSKWVNTSTLWRLVHGTDERFALERIRVAETGELQHANSITSLAYAPDAELMLTGSLDRSARLWSLPKGNCIAAFQGHTDAVWDVDISADGQRIVTASADGTARLWPGDPLTLAKRLEPAGLAASFGPLPLLDAVEAQRGK